mgnify:CR=1 FL=1
MLHVDPLGLASRWNPGGAEAGTPGNGTAGGADVDGPVGLTLELRAVEGVRLAGAALVPGGDHEVLLQVLTGVADAADPRAAGTALEVEDRLGGVSGPGRDAGHR